MTRTVSGIITTQYKRGRFVETADDEKQQRHKSNQHDSNAPNPTSGTVGVVQEGEQYGQCKEKKAR